MEEGVGDRPMKLIESEIARVYNQVRSEVGRDYDGAFVPEIMSTRLSEALGILIHKPVPGDFFLPAFDLSEVPLYPDAEDFLFRLGLEEESLVCFLTKGQVFDNRNISGDLEDVGFQNRKIRKAGVPEYIGQHAIQTIQSHGLPFINGGFDKAHPSVLDPICETALRLGRDLFYFDDSVNELRNVAAYCEHKGIQHVGLYWINRNSQNQKDQPEIVHEISSFREIEVSNLKGGIVLLDYDGTIGDRQYMREYLFNRVVTYAQRL